MGYVLFWVAVLAFILWRNAQQDPESGVRRPDREFPDPDHEQELLAALGPIDAGLSLTARGCEWSLAAPNPVAQKGTRIVVSGLCPLLDICAGSASDIEVGDPALDAALTMIGPPPLLRAILDAPAREAVMALMSSPSLRPGSLRVRDGQLRADALPDPAYGVHRHSETIARLAVAAAARLQAPDDLPARLAANARDDPEPGVRLSSLRTLAREFPEDGNTAAAIRAGSGDRDGDVRLAAARALGDEGRQVLWALAEDTTVDDSCSAQAVAELADASPAELSGILAAAQVAQRGRGGPARPHTARACVEALGRCGEEAVPILETALRSENEAVALATIRALDRIGGPAVVIPLQEAVEHHSGGVQRAAATALGDVQARLIGTPGQISLAVGDSGQVSLAEDAAGQVSLEEPVARPDAPAAERRRPVKQ